MKKNEINSPQSYINRELSWLQFNNRVLAQALQPDLPLLERLKFMAIVSSNLDEFFMVRVAGLMQQRSAKRRKRGVSGMTPVQQIEAISQAVHEMVHTQTLGIKDICESLAREGLQLLERSEWTLEQRNALRDRFHREMLPVLTPLAMDQLDPVPLLPGRVLNVGLLVRALDSSGKPKAGVDAKLVVIPIPNLFSRFVPVGGEAKLCLARIEDILADNAGLLYENHKITATSYFRLTRDADVEIQEDEAGDLLSTLEQAMLERRRRAAVRLEISTGADKRIRDWAQKTFGLDEQDIYDVDGLLDATALMDIAGRSGFDHLKIPEWSPQPARDMDEGEDIFENIRDHDILLFHPYETFDPVVDLLEKAAEDSNVLSIKQTLYRTSGDSPIIAALERAAENGKQVAVLVELKARFDEERNLTWAKRLENAGCHVIYGIAGLKTHCKALLVVRREGSRISRYVHLSTGNYNDKTARLYSDIGLMSSDPTLATDVTALFNVMTGASEAVGLSKLVIAPTALRQRFKELIEREIQVSTPDRPGFIMVKVNSLEDKDICKCLYRASQAGVRILLNVRGICCLRPGVEGLSENIRVVSIVDRYLEHARIFYFTNAGRDEIYLGSADWMGRNLDRRVETMFPITDPKLKTRLQDILETFFKDNCNSMELQPDGSYKAFKKGKNRIRAQEVFYEEACMAAKSATRARQRFRPLTQPKK